MSDRLIACPTARTGYPTRDAAQRHLDDVKQSLSPRARSRANVLEVQTCEHCEGFHVVQPKMTRTQTTH